METKMEQGTARANANVGVRGSFLSAGLSALDDLMAGGEMLPAQLPAASDWSAEKRLAAAVLASALVEIRDHHGSPGHRRPVAEALEWIAADASSWPYSFVRLCELFGLEVDWVRGVVASWLRVPVEQRKPISFLYRQAA